MPAANRLVQAAIRRFRRQRMRQFERFFSLTPSTRVLDVGGTPANWEFTTVRPHLTILNTPRAKETVPPDVHWVSGDGRRLPFPDRSFDIVFSNSVIEHVGDLAAQRAFAEEIARVGIHYWVQTPNRRFPLELHLLTPFLHYLPRSWQRRLIPRFNIWQLLARPTPAERDYYISHYLNEVRLLDAANLRALFPAARLIRERFLGFTKALIAAR
jgi:SAM-dependent methyltransferase